MGKKFVTSSFLLLCGIFSAIPSAFAAKDARGKEIPQWYASLGGSLVFLDKYTTGFNNDIGFFAPASLTFSPGFAMRGTVGYRINPYLSTEGELAYYRASVNSQTNVGSGASSARKAPQRATAIMGNAYLHYPNATLFTPYAGVGAGGVNIQTPLVGVLGNGESQKLEDWVFGYQFMAGLSYELPKEMVGFKSEIILGYRYLHADQGEIRFSSIPYGYGVLFDNTSQNADLMWRFYF